MSYHWVKHTPIQHTLSTSYTEYSIHRVQHTPSTAYTEYCINPRSTVSCCQPVSHLWADVVVLNSLHSHDYKVTNKSCLSCRHRSLPIYRLQIDHLQVLLQSQSIMAFKCISKLTRSRPPSVSPDSLYNGLQVHRSVTRSQPPKKSANSLNYGLHVHLWVQLDLRMQVHLQTHSIAASKYIPQFTQSRPPCASLNSVTQRLEVLLSLCSSNVCSQIGHMYIYTKT